MSDKNEVAVKLEEAPIVARPEAGAVDMSSQREIAEVQAAMILAKRFPRDEKEALDRILVACQRPLLAGKAMYSYSRGGADITGPSIRLAEAIAREWGNIHFGIKELEQRGGESTMEAFAWDVERNTYAHKRWQVKHMRYTKAKTYALDDPRDIYETTANQGSRRMRACILSLIPSDIVEAAVEECTKTAKVHADVTPEGIKKMLDAFESFDVTKEMIEKKIQRGVFSITPAQKVSLGAIYNSLRDGMSVASDWFEVFPSIEDMTKKLAGGNEKVKAALAAMEG